MAASVAVCGLVAACSSAPSTASLTDVAGSSPSSSTTRPSPATTPAATPSPSGGSAAGGTLTLDPCRLVPQGEASALAKAQLGAGKRESTSSSGAICVYGGQTLTVVDVVVGRASSAEVARADFDQEQSRALDYLKQNVPAGVDVTFTPTTIPGLGDRAAATSGSVSIGGVKIGASAIYVLKGATFFAISELSGSGAPASVAALKAEANLVLGRI